MMVSSGGALIDAHVHVWDPRLLPYAWLDGTPLDEPMLPERYDRGGVDAGGAIFVEAADPGIDPVAEARWVNSLPWPELVAIVAAADLTAPLPLVRRQLAALAEIPRVVGVRHLLQDVPAERFPLLRPGLAELASRGGTFDACIRHHQLPALAALVREVPQLTVVVDHVAKPPVDEGIGSAAGRDWAAGISELAERPGTFVKLSGLTGESGDPAAFERHADGFLRHAVAAFGPQRAMIASDWPVSATFGVGGTFAAWVARVRAVVPAQQWPEVAAGTARRAYLPHGVPGLAATGD